MQNVIHKLFDLSGRKALVTGASSGLGRHFAKTLSAAGANVVVASRSQKSLQRLVEEIQQTGGWAQSMPMDVTDRRQVSECLDEIGCLDVLVNNAGVSDHRPFFAYDDDSWDKILETDLKGAWVVAQETSRRMVSASQKGSIINITSILASRVAGGVSPYTAAKAGLAQLTRAMALELGRYGIRVNSLAPGYVVTNLNAEFLHSEAGERLRSRIPTKRFNEPADLDGALLLLASDAGRSMTGTELIVDGGHLCSGL